MAHGHDQACATWDARQLEDGQPDLRVGLRVATSQGLLKRRADLRLHDRTQARDQGCQRLEDCVLGRKPVRTQCLPRRHESPSRERRGRRCLREHGYARRTWTLRHRGLESQDRHGRRYGGTQGNPEEVGTESQDLLAPQAVPHLRPRDQRYSTPLRLHRVEDAGRGSPSVARSYGPTSCTSHRSGGNTCLINPDALALAEASFSFSENLLRLTDEQCENNYLIKEIR